jgi:hypothetical protein
LYQPLLNYVTELEAKHPDRQIAVVVPELIDKRWYHAWLHDHHAALIKTLLLLRGGPQIVVIAVPFYVANWLPERRELRQPEPREPSRSSDEPERSALPHQDT